MPHDEAACVNEKHTHKKKNRILLDSDEEKPFDHEEYARKQALNQTDEEKREAKEKLMLHF